MEGEVSDNTFTLFLRHMYGCKMEVAEIAELSTLAELHSITCQFEQAELGREVKERLRDLVNNMEMREACAMVELSTLLVRHKVEELLPLVEEKVKATQVGEEDLAGLLCLANDGGPQANVGSLF